MQQSIIFMFLFLKKKMFEMKTKMDIWKLNHVYSHYLNHSTRYLFL